MSEQQWYELRPVDAQFADSAPSRYVIEADIAMPRQAVWDAFADPSTWKHWWPGVSDVIYEGTKPDGVGTLRKSVVNGENFHETMLVWDEPAKHGIARWGYRIDRATLALASAQLEITEFEDSADGTLVRWILAVDPLQDFEQFAQGQTFEQFLQDLLGQALGRLQTYFVA